MTENTVTDLRETMEGYLRNLSNWGRWGSDDRLGTLNLITPEVRLAAKDAIRSGVAVSLSRDLDPAHPDPVHSGVTNVERRSLIGETTAHFGVSSRWDAVGEEITLSPHGGNAHLDGLGHYYWDGLFYNGFAASESNADIGSAHLAVSDATEGIVSRGVLLDIAGLFGVEFVERGYAVTPADLLAAEARQNVKVRSGDVLLIHTGNGAALVKHGPLFRDGRTGIIDGVQSGLDVSCMELLREWDVAAMGADGTHDVQPSLSDDFSYVRPIHTISLVGLGLWLLDNLDLTQLAAECARAEQWDFLFSALPWRFVGATSSPLNPVAVL